MFQNAIMLITLIKHLAIPALAIRKSSMLRPVTGARLKNMCPPHFPVSPFFIHLNAPFCFFLVIVPTSLDSLHLLS